MNRAERRQHELDQIQREVEDARKRRHELLSIAFRQLQRDIEDASRRRDQLIFEAARAGMSRREIAAVTGMSLGSVQGAIEVDVIGLNPLHERGRYARPQECSK
jgi:hypothetical protein